MTPIKIKGITADLPYMTLDKGQAIYDLIVQHGLKSCLELGFYHGVSSLYIAGALEDIGGGKLFTVDKINARELRPNIFELLEKADLAQYVEQFFEPRSFTWRLMKFLQQGRQETFDFCYLDAGHSWDTTGFAFFLVARLLKPGGWIIFDDLNWSYARSPKLKDSAAVAAMAEDERTTPQVRRVFELLVKTDPDFTLTFELNGWGYAQKGTLRLRAGL